MRVFPSQRKKWYIKTSNPSWLQVQRWKPTVRFFHQNPDRARKLVFSHTWPVSLAPPESDKIESGTHKNCQNYFISSRTRRKRHLSLFQNLILFSIFQHLQVFSFSYAISLHKDILHSTRGRAIRLCVCLSSTRWSHLNCFCQRDASPMFMCGNFDKENHEFFFCFFPFSPALASFCF